jgi:hypothetical protein
VRVSDDKKAFEPYELDPCNYIRNHSPAGFQWGYGGSGPAQLALALCVDALGVPVVAEAIYQTFKWVWVAHVVADKWELTHVELMGFIREALNHEQQRG